ncbi:MAG: hypothetical protein QMD61_00745 [Methanobacterium sp.]|nr:hypothetical protein [Methanobacterium sp.]
MEIKLHKTIDIRIKDVNNFKDAEDRVDQVLDSLRAEILQEVEDVLTEEAEGC